MIKKTTFLTKTLLFALSSLSWNCFATPIPPSQILDEFISYQKKQAPIPPITGPTITHHDNVTQITYTMQSQLWPTQGMKVCPLPLKYEECLKGPGNNSWKHTVDIYIPEGEIESTKALLYLGSDVTTGGGSGDKGFVNFANVASQTHMVAVALSEEPYQGENEDGVLFPPFYLFPLSEDFLIGKSWAYFLSDPDKYAFMPAHMPMVFAAMETMDLVQNHFVTIPAPMPKIDSFVVAGVSKRGWATWLTAIEDNRVTAIVPTVIDFLNTKFNINRLKDIFHNYYPIAYLPYWIFGVSPTANHFDELMTLQDPLAYLKLESKKDRFKYLTKYMVNASGDDIFIPDNSQYYIGDLNQDGSTNILRYMVNTGHEFDASQLANYSLIPFLNRNKGSTPQLPSLTYKVTDAPGTKNHLLELNFTNEQGSDNAVKSVIVWQATNEKYRDFRYACNDQLKTAYVPHVQNLSNSTEHLSYTITEPDNGWGATFAEITYNDNFVVTTPVYVFPNKNPDVLPNTIYPVVPFSKLSGCSILMPLPAGGKKPTKVPAGMEKY